MEQRETGTIEYRGSLREMVHGSECYLIFIAMYFFVQCLLHNTKLTELTGVAQGLSRLWTGLWLMIRVLIFLKVLVEFRNKDYKALLLLGFALILQRCGTGTWISDMLWLIAALKNVELKRLLYWTFVAKASAFFVIIGLAALQIIPNVTLQRSTGELRYAIGFFHPNILASRVFELLALYVCLKGRRLKVGHGIGIMGIALATHWITDSRASYYVTMGLGVFTILVCIANKPEVENHFGRIFVGKGIQKLKYLLMVMPVIAVVLVVCSSTLRNYVTGTMSSRVTQAILYYRNYGLSLFGQKLAINNQLVNRRQSQLYTLDNGYMFLLLGYGLVSFVLFLYGQIRLGLRLSREKKYIYLVVLALFALFGFVETAMIRVDMNFTLLFFGILLWDSTQEKVSM